MYRSTSIRWHLLRGIAALSAIDVALRVGIDHLVVAIFAVLSAIVLLRGCPMCWLLGLFERIGQSTPQANTYKDMRP